MSIRVSSNELVTFEEIFAIACRKLACKNVLKIKARGFEFAVYHHNDYYFLFLFCI